MDDIANKLMSITKLVCVLIVGMTLFSVMRAAVTTTAALNSISRGGQSQPSSIAGGLSSSDIRNRTAELKAKMAPRSAVLGAATRLTVIGVAFDRRVGERLDAAGAKGDGSRQATAAQKIALSAPLALRVDFATVSRRAAVLLTDESVDLSVNANKAINSYAMLGIESQSFPRVANVAAGTLGGFKIGDTYAGPANHPVDFVDASIRGRMCSTFRDWAKHFSVPANEVEYVIFRDPTEVYHDGSQWTSDGETVTRLDTDDLARAVATTEREAGARRSDEPQTYFDHGCFIARPSVIAPPAVLSVGNVVTCRKDPDRR